jgi:hypothetical protein
MRRLCLSFALALILLISLVGPAGAADPIPAEGSFTADINFETLELAPVGANCQLQVEGVVTFTGTLEGQGNSVTTALILAPCSLVAETPPGTYRDVFTADIQFEGTLDGEPVTAGIRYHGTVAEGGAIGAVMNFSGDLRGSVKVQGQAAVGGDYSGKIVMK